MTDAKPLSKVTRVTLGSCLGTIIFGLYPLANAQDKSWELEIAYTADVWTLAKGGTDQSPQYLDNLTLAFGADLEKAINLRGGRLFVSTLYNNGESISDFARDAQIISNIETGVEAFRLYEAWLEQDIGDQATIRVGLYDVNSEFDVLDSAGLFINSGHGIGSTIGLSGDNGPSIFPITGFGARIDYHFENGWRTRFAILDGVPGDPGEPDKTVISLGNGDGSLTLAELEIPLREGKLLAGAWGYTADFDAFDGTRNNGNTGWYLRAESKLYTSTEDPESSVSGFLRFGCGDGRFNAYNRFASAGLVYDRLFPARPEDQLGIAVAAAFTSDEFKQTGPIQNAEINIELTYSAQITDWLRLQPDLQYIVHPSAIAQRSDVLALGLRFEVGHTF